MYYATDVRERLPSRPLYRYVAELAKDSGLTETGWEARGRPGQKLRVPVPFFNVINGGAHAGNRLGVQEIMIAPVAATSFYHGASSSASSSPLSLLAPPRAAERRLRERRLRGLVTFGGLALVGLVTLSHPNTLLTPWHKFSKVSALLYNRALTLKMIEVPT
jgi:hypothetical protein